METSREKILQMVSEGKLSVAEGLDLLGRLDQEQPLSEDQLENLAKKSETISSESVQEGQLIMSEMKEDKDQPEEDPIKKASAAFFNLFDTAVKKVKELDLDFVKPEKFEHIFQYSDTKVEELSLELTNGNVELIPWEHEDIRFECSVKSYTPGNREDLKEDFIKNTTFKVKDSKLYFMAEQKMLTVNMKCYLPKKDYQAIDVEIFNGKLKLGDLKTKQLTAELVNGQQSLKSLKVESAKLSTSNGDIEMENCKIDEVRANILNGDLNFDGEFYNAKLKTFNGYIDCELYGDRPNYAEFDVTTGAIKVLLPSPLLEKNLYGQLKTNFGNFKISVGEYEPIEEVNDIGNKLLTFRKSKQSEEEFHFFATSKTGSITVLKK